MTFSMSIFYLFHDYYSVYMENLIIFTTFMQRRTIWNIPTF